MDSLVKIGGSGKAIVNLTNKLSEGIGWIANRETPQKIGQEIYTQSVLNQADLDPLTRAALVSYPRQVIRHYKNQHDIYQIACQTIQSDAKPEDVEDDWLNQFMEKAKLVSSKDFQLIWGKVLARECNEPNSIPLSLLHILEIMEKEDAEAFTALCRVSVRLEKDYSPIIISSKLDDYNALAGITLDKLVLLESLDLIKMDLGMNGFYIVEAETTPAKVVYFDEEYELSGDEKSIKTGNVLFTKAGQALCEVVTAEKIEGFWETYCLPFWKD